MLRIGIVTGEASGDLLGADLLTQLRQHSPDIIVEGIGGPKMEAAGCKIVFPMDRLAVIGLVEVLGRYTELLRLRQNIYQHFISEPPDVFVGIDAPDFNLGLEKKLRAKGIKTVHYVSPSVWAWRKNRIKKIKQAVDLMLTLFPFEHEFYQQQAMPSQYVGHPLANKISLHADKALAIKRLGLEPAKPIIALLPGSRDNELKKLCRPFIQTALCVQKRLGQVQFITSVLTLSAVEKISAHVSDNTNGELKLSLYQDKMADVLQAADVALLASGTVSLEAMLYKCPMVVAYKTNTMTFNIIKAMASIEYVALPNILAKQQLVSECLQKQCEPQYMANELCDLLVDKEKRKKMIAAFSKLHQELLTERADIAATAILNMVAKKC